MALDPGHGRRSISPSGSGRSSPVPRAAKKTVEEGLFKADKALRRYGGTIERALTSWEVSPQEWADYIAFLARLLKAIQTHPKDPHLLPHSDDVAYKLAQCLNPALPSGVHQKALEVYEYIFATFGEIYISGHLHDFLPGLSAVLSFASLSVRPALYSIFEDYIIPLPPEDLRPVLKSLILSLLPALEEETGEDFERAFYILQNVKQKFSPLGNEETIQLDKDGYFWQCLFLAIITSPSRRPGALSFLVQTLPKFGPSTRTSTEGSRSVTNGLPGRLSHAAELVISPEPGLLIRCFVCGLSDTQLLIQRGFLDLLVTHVPLNSPLLLEKVGREDLDRLVSAAMHVLLRKEMSLNKRLWSWFLGPDPKANATDSNRSSPVTEKKAPTRAQEEQQYQYFSNFVRVPLERCVLAMFKRTATNAADKARPFRICHSLMDRWEVGGSIVPHMFLPAIRSAYDFSLKATPNETAEMMRSASLFFDGIEASLIWANLIGLLKNAFTVSGTDSGLQTFRWIVQHFNIQDEEMLIAHIPYATVYLLALLVDEKRPRSASRSLAAIEIVSALLDMIPERAFGSPSSDSIMHSMADSSPHDANVIRQIFDSYYQKPEQPMNDDIPMKGQDVSVVLYRLSISLLLGSLGEGDEMMFSRMVSVLLVLYTKATNPEILREANVFAIIFERVERTTSGGRILAFPTISAILSLLSIRGSTPGSRQLVTPAEIIKFERSLTVQIWHYLSPSVPKYHVEAVKSIWQLQELVGSEDCIQSSLVELVRRPSGSLLAPTVGRADSLRRFTVLWDHTIPVPSSTAHHSPRGLTRRVSTMPSLSDAKQAVGRQKILIEPLIILLDLLNGPEQECIDIVENWLRNLMTLETVLAVHFDTTKKLIGMINRPEESAEAILIRMHGDSMRQLEYIVGHFESILRCANEWTWHCLGEMTISKGQNTDLASGLLVLADHCCNFLCDDRYTRSNLEQVGIRLLNTMLSAPSVSSLTALDLDSRLMNRMMDRTSKTSIDLQGPLLQLITQSLRLRTLGEPSLSSTDVRPGSSGSSNRPTTTAAVRSSNSANTSLATSPPPQLSNFLHFGLSSSFCRPYLDQWIEFLSSILPIFADAIFTNLIPLVECLCTELHKVHNDLVSITQMRSARNPVAPEATTMALLDALEMILVRAHDCLGDDRSTESTSKLSAQSRSLLGNVASGVFRAEGPPSKTAQANSRLTVVLAFQDAIRVSSKLWTWATQYSNTEDFDRSSTSTAAYNALRVRNRTRNLVEILFAAEPLESLEVVISNWWYSDDLNQAAAALDLLHVIQGLRPKVIVPTILDALCSRVNPAVLPSTRQSCQTTDLTALEVSMFLSAYLQSTEDDAMDEVWSDCMTFFRDVLANPLPYRQILPALLSTILLLAQKVDNTNFGEQRKMRRDLGDLFLRFLVATFTAMPSGAIEMQSSNADATGSADQRSISLVAVLKNTIGNIEVILENPDRITTAVNNISGSLVNLVFHAKAFPGNVTSDLLNLILEMSKKAPAAKSWKKELMDAFNDSRLLMTSAELMENDWFPVLRQWCLHDKERIPELLSRLTAPTSAGIMFGVGASAARLEADRRAQLNLRRLCIMLLACPEDSFVTMIRVVEEKLAELFDATSSSSPSAVVKAELFMVCRTLSVSMSTIHLAPLWPIMNSSMQSALMSLLPGASDVNTFGNLSLLQACKLLDLLVAISPDEFQLHEWLFITDTIDAVYQPSQWKPTALSDQVAEALSSEGMKEQDGPITPAAFSNPATGHRRPLLDNERLLDADDIKAMARDDFARLVLKPFLGQLSLHAYEGVYSIGSVDLASCRRNILEDLLELRTVVE